MSLKNMGREQRTLELDLVLNNEGVILVVDSLGEFGRNGVVSSLVLDDQSLVTLHALEHRRLLDSPGTDVRPLLIVGLDILLRVRRLPPAFPVVGELLQERGLEFGGLQHIVSIANSRAHSDYPQ